jgi:carbonyl reductase 1/carbonyl reductase 3
MSEKVEKKKGKKEKEEKKTTDTRKTLLITGGNRGLGYAIIENLLEKKTKLKLIITSRNEEQGQEIYNSLCEKYPEEKEKEQLYYHQLDITNEESINEIIEYIKKNFKKIDYLINNAGVSSKGTEFSNEVFEYTFSVNVYGTINFTEKMISNNLINKQGKIILLGGKSGNILKLKNDNLINLFKTAKAADDLFKIADKFKEAINDETCDEEGWYKNTYGVSKMIINTYARLLTKKREISREGISVFSCHPGWLKTEMGGNYAKVDVKDGANNVIYLIELPDGINKDLQGKFFEEGKVSNFGLPEK